MFEKDILELGFAVHLQQSLPKIHVRKDGRKCAASLQGILGPFLQEKITLRINRLNKICKSSCNYNFTRYGVSAMVAPIAKNA